MTSAAAECSCTASHSPPADTTTLLAVVQSRMDSTEVAKETATRHRRELVRMDKVTLATKGSEQTEFQIGGERLRVMIAQKGVNIELAKAKESSERE